MAPVFRFWRDSPAPWIPRKHTGKRMNNRGLAPAILAAGLLASGPLGADELLEEMTRLARGGTPELAMRLMDRYQPSAQTDPQGWMRWQQERVQILRERGDWQAVLSQVRFLPRGLPAEFRTWVETVQAEAEIELGREAQARRRLAGLLWGAREARLKAHLPEWRRLIIRSYLAEGRIDDAYTAMLRYELDYGERSEEWRLLSAQVLLRAGRARDAANLLGKAESVEGQVLHLLAGSRTGLISRTKLREQAKGLLRTEGLDDLLAYQLWGVLAESARDAGSHGQWVRALEQGLALRHRVPAAESPVKVDADALWEAYDSHAQALANRKQLLVGRFEQWFDLAKRQASKNAVRSRSLYAYLATSATTQEQRQEAHRLLMALLMDTEGGTRILRELYLESQRYAELAQVPKAVRYALVDLALAEADVDLASRLMSDLAEPPPGIDEMTWRLQRARLLILGGQSEQGIEELQALIEAQESFDPALLDRTNQVVFDLQTLGEHETAYGLFSLLFDRVSDPKLRRELLYWMAESLAEQERHAEAARLYMKSAMLPEPHIMDPWAQTARYQAAAELTKAGLVRDARGIYENLIRVTTDPARRAALQRAMHQLWLSTERAPAASGGG